MSYHNADAANRLGLAEETARMLQKRPELLGLVLTYMITGLYNMNIQLGELDETLDRLEAQIKRQSTVPGSPYRP